MESLGSMIRKLREEKKLPLRTIASYLNIDQAILSKIEHGHRKASRDQVIMLSKYFNVKENDLLVAWLSDKLVYALKDETIALQALHVAEDKIEYKIFLKVDRKKLLAQIKQVIKQFPKIQNAWIYGSFARQDDGPKSDIDIALKTDEDFSYFDLADVQHHLEKKVNRKVDVGFMDSFQPYILEHVKADMKLIYER